MEDPPSTSSWLWLFLLCAWVVPGLAPVLVVLAAAIAPTVVFVAASSRTGAKQEQQLTAAAVSCRPTGQETVSTTATTLTPQQGIDSSARALPQVAKEDPAQLAAERVARGGATSAPPCAGCCQGSSSCPWHLPMALSLSLWGQDSFRFTCSKPVSDTGRGSSFSNTSSSRVLDQQYPADAFTFASTAHTGDELWQVPTMPGLLRSLSAAAAGPARHAAEHMPAHSSAYVLSLAPHQQQVQDMPAQTAGQSAAASVNRTMPPWAPKAAAAAAAAAAACQGSLAPTAGPGLAVAPAAAVNVPEAEGFPAAYDEDAVTPTSMPAPQPQQPDSSVLDWQEPYTPPGQLPSQLLSVLQHIWHEDQQCLSTPGSCPAQMQQSYADIGDTCSQPLPSHPYPPQQQEAVYSGPTNPLPVIATTSRHSMCMRRPSGKLSSGGSPLAGSFSSSSFGGGAQPLPSPAESPLARRLSERDGAGFPTSPQLVELLSSGRRLQRGLSLDSSRRSVSTPGSTRCSLEAQHQQQQQHPRSAPWSGLQLRSIAHVLQQRQQQQQQESSLTGDAATWYRADRLERRHTFSSSTELSVSADGAAAAHDFAAAAAAAVGSCHSSSKPPYRRHTMIMMRSSSGGSSCSGTDGMASPSLTSAGSLTPHRLSCCSSATNPLLDTAADNKEDAAAGSLACKSYKELFALWSANERGQQQEQQ